MTALGELAASLPEHAKDIKLNLAAVLEGGSLSVAQRWGVALACAAASRNPRLRDAVLGEAVRQAGPELVDDALAAAALMALNNVYYRFRHVIGKPSYAEKPARLRMNRLARPATSRLDFELFSLAVSAVNGCEACMRAHERVVLEGGLSEDQVNDAVRIAATVQAVAVADESGQAPPSSSSAEKSA